MICIQLHFERLSEILEKIRGEGGELIAVLAAIAFRCGAIMTLAELHEEMQRSHLHRLIDALGQLGLDPLTEPARVVRAVAEAGGAERIVHQALGNMRRSPRASGSGCILKSA